MNQPQNFSAKTDMQEALKSKFYLTSVFLFWLLTGVAFVYAVVNSQQDKIHNSTELSSEAP